MLQRLVMRSSSPTSDDRFQRWLQAVSPMFNWEWPHTVYVRKQLDAVTAGTLKKLMIFLPPRHGKSELCTIRYPAFRLELNEDSSRVETLHATSVQATSVRATPTHATSVQPLRVIVGAYNQTLADKFSRRTRRIVEERLGLSSERSAVEEWETPSGGSLRAVGVGAGITGQGGDLIIIDDPVKSREEADSPAYRDRVWDWYTNDLYTRQEPGCAMVLIMTRWHKDDLAGRILASDDGPHWTVVNLPAEAEENDPLGRPVGAALCPDRFDLAKLADIKRVMARDYYALYQQRPQAREGGMFKEHWLPLCEAVPRNAQRVRWWDRAATAGAGDYTAGVLVAYADGVWFIEDVVRGQWSSGERDRVVLDTAHKDRARYGDVEIWTEQEPGSSGKDKAVDFVKMLAGFDVDAEPSTGSKIARAEALSKQAEWGNVRVLRAAWSGAFLSEMTDFPTGVHDDQVDAAASAFNKLALVQRMEIGESPMAGYRG
jgi:predicted phage terminase large subunit-like protein